MIWNIDSLQYDILVSMNKNNHKISFTEFKNVVRLSNTAEAI